MTDERNGPAWTPQHTRGRRAVDKRTAHPNQWQSPMILLKLTHAAHNYDQANLAFQVTRSAIGSARDYGRCGAIDADALPGMNEHRTTAGGQRPLRGVVAGGASGRWLHGAQGRPAACELHTPRRRQGDEGSRRLAS